MSERGRFEALCDDLRRNDPETTEIPAFSFPGHGRRLGEALQGNEYVSTIKLSYLLYTNNNDEDTESVALLLRYIRESEAMRKVCLRQEVGGLPAVDGYPSAVRLFLLASMENPCIEALALDATAVPPEAFALLLRTTQSLKTVIITSHDDWRAAGRELVADAFGTNRTLESLAFSYHSNTATVESILLRLGSHPCLRKLELCPDSRAAEINALTHLLRSTKTAVEHLTLNRTQFDKERMECLVEGLHLNQSLTKLSMERCHFDLEAKDVFRSFMQKGDSRSSIRELCIVHHSRAFASQTDGTMLASMLTTPDENHETGSSIGSTLQDLFVDFVDDDFAAFCRALAANASRIRLPCLRFGYNSTVRKNDFDLQEEYDYDSGWSWDWGALYSCLPKLVYLKELHIRTPWGDRQFTFRNFVDALLHNGSLQHVVITEFSDTDGDEFFDEAELRLVQLYCKRNEWIPILLSKARQDEANDADKTDLSLLPMLFQAAKQAPRTAPNAMMIGLLAAGDSIRPRHRHDRKRVRDSC